MGTSRPLLLCTLPLFFFLFLHVRPSSTFITASVHRQRSGTTTPPARTTRTATVTAAGAEEAAAADEWGITRTPTPDLPPEDVVPMLMKAMHLNSFPDDDSGLATVYDWSSDMCRRACGRSAEEFIKMSKNSVFGMCVGGGGDWKLMDPRMVGNNMYSVKVEVPSPDKRPSRFFLWQLRKEMRPPACGAWLIHGVIASDFEGLIQEGD